MIFQNNIWQLSNYLKHYLYPCIYEWLHWNCQNTCCIWIYMGRNLYQCQRNFIISIKTISLIYCWSRIRCFLSFPFGSSYNYYYWNVFSHDNYTFSQVFGFLLFKISSKIYFLKNWFRLKICFINTYFNKMI